MVQADILFVKHKMDVIWKIRRKQVVKNEPSPGSNWDLGEMILFCLGFS